MGNKTIFCGDGINDLPALAAADVGMSIGATEAVIAAVLSTSQGSVAGAHSYAIHQYNSIVLYFKIAFTLHVYKLCYRLSQPCRNLIDC